MNDRQARSEHHKIAIVLLDTKRRIEDLSDHFKRQTCPLVSGRLIAFADSIGQGVDDIDDLLH